MVFFQSDLSRSVGNRTFFFLPYTAEPIVSALAEVFCEIVLTVGHIVAFLLVALSGV